MKIASISGVTNYVKDIEKTAAFYNELGFRLGEQNSESLTVYINWFWIRFQLKGSADASMAKEHESLLSLKVVDVDEFYDGVVALGHTPLSSPEDKPWGHREFILQDPDGYKLVFFQKAR